MHMNNNNTFILFHEVEQVTILLSLETPLLFMKQTRSLFWTLTYMRTLARYLIAYKMIAELSRESFQDQLPIHHNGLLETVW